MTQPAEVSTKSSPRMDEILSRAAELFYKKGYHSTTIEDVAREVGMLKGSLYYYIRSKEDLLYQLLIDVIVNGTRGLDNALKDADGPVDRLEKAIGEHIRYIINNQTRVGLFLHEFDRLSGKRQKRIREEMTKYQQAFLEIVRDGQAKQLFVEADAWLLVNGMLGIGNWIYRWHGRGQQHEPEEVIKTFVSMIVNGIIRN